MASKKEKNNAIETLKGIGFIALLLGITFGFVTMSTLFQAGFF